MMTGFERLKEQIKGQKDPALLQTVEYLLSRNDLEEKYLSEDKNIKDMAEYIKSKGKKHCTNGWNYITNEVVYAWAVMYFSLPNAFLNISNSESKKVKQSSKSNNVIEIETAKEKISNKKEVAQISLFGGV